MSSTNRGAIRPDGDFYRTPEWCVKKILPALPKGSVLDPCAGDGAILRAVDGTHAPLSGIEINPALCVGAQCIGTFIEEKDALLDSTNWGRPNLVLMNPPFNLALEFVRKAIEVQKPHGGTVAALLRLSFLASKKRKEFFIANPCDVHVLSKRPSFTGHGTDSCDYAFFIWGPGRGNHWAIL